MIGAGVLALAPAAARADAGYVPGQFVAKQYTEALGRVPDQAGWKGLASYFTSDGCNATTLANVGKSIYTSSEFAGLKYDNAAKVLTLYRGALNHEPDQAGFDNWIGQLKDGMAWSTVVGKFFGSDEFTRLVPTICSGVSDGAGASYHFGTTPALALGASGSGFTGTQAELQKKLNATPKGGTVHLAKRALVRLTSRLTIPAGVTLDTAGAPDPRHYANMGRLVRGSAFNDRQVVLEGGARLTNVWVDGARGNPGNSDPSRDSIVLQGGDGTAVTHSRVTDSAGPQAVYALGAFDGYGCAKATISGNVITAYSSAHFTPNQWSDGIATGCEHTSITENEVVDASDVPIVVYRSQPVVGDKQVAQQSTVRGNTVLNAGNSAFGGMGFDPLSSDPLQKVSFEGAKLTGNRMWTSPTTHYEVGLVDGTRAWFGAKANTGTGAAMTGNTTGTQTARVATGIGVSGMLDTTVSDNAMRWTHTTAAGGTCPQTDVAASLTAGTASGSITPTPKDVAFDGCV